nr:BTAD domain-containing putative transcriptional regulator [Planomonospora venezuelensis]
MLLAVLALAEGRPLAPAVLIDRLWGRDAPAEATASLHAYVSNLRRALEPGRRPRTPSRALVLGPAGYALAVEPERVDASRFVRLVAEAGRAGDPVVAERQAAAALALWRGTPYAELDGQEYALAAQARLEEARERARELRVAAVLEQGRHDEVLGELEALTGEHPLRERLWGLRALGLYRAGRQGEALAVLRTARRVLAEELGIDPGDELRGLERDILAQSPRLRLGAAVVSGTAAGGLGAAAGEGLAGRVLAGRRGELAALEEALAGAEAGRPGFALVTGEPGIGKTRLAEELAARARARGHLVAVGRCAAIEGAPAFWPWTMVLERLAEVVEPLPEAVRANLPGAGSADRPDPEGARFRTYQAAARVLAAAAAVRPVLVVLDDLHWADPSSLRLLGYLAETAGEGRLLVVGTARDLPSAEGALADAFESLARRHAVRLPLAGLSADELAALAPGLAEEEVRALRERTGGNPFFATELVRYLGAAPGSAAGPGGSCVRGVLPLGVRDVVLGRVGRLPEAAAEVLRIAAVVGREFEAPVVAAVAGLGAEEVLDRLEPALAAALVVQGRPGRFRFVHALVAEALADAVAPLRRARLHARVAEAIEARTGSAGAGADGLAVVAHHWLLAVPAGHVRRAWPAAVRAGREAMRLRAYDAAAGLLERAAAVAAGDAELSAAERMDVLFALADARIGAGDARGQRLVLEEIRALARRAGDRRRWIAAATGYGGRILQPWETYGRYNTELVGELHELVRTDGAGPARWVPRPGGGDGADPARQGAEEGLDPVSRARALACLAVETYYRTGPDPAERERWSREAVELARKENDATLLGRMLFARFTALLNADAVGERIEAAEEMVAAGRAAGDDELLATGLICLAGALLETLRVGRALGALAEAEALVERSQLPYLRIILGWLRLGVVAGSGDTAGAEALLAATAAEHQATSMWGAEVTIAAGTHQVALLRARQGTLAPGALEALEAPGDWPEPLEEVIREARAALQVASGRPDEARRTIGPWERQRPIPDTFLLLHRLGMRAEIWSALGDERACAELYAQALPYADRMVMGGLSSVMWPMSRSLFLLARALGDREAALRHGGHALAVAREMGAGALVALIAAELA